MIHSTDSSLLDEWEKLRNPDTTPQQRDTPAPVKLIPYTRNKNTLTRDVRSTILGFVKFLSQGRYEDALSQIQSDLKPSELKSIMMEYYQSHGNILLDPEARNTKHTRIQELPEKGIWEISQTLLDQEDLNDYTATFELHLEATEANQSPDLHLISIGM